VTGVLYLTDADVQQLVSMQACIELMDRVFRDTADGRAESRPRQHLSLPGRGFHRVMIGGEYGLNAFGLKTYAAAERGPRYMVLLYEASNAHLQAIVEAKYVGQLRTGAAAGLATRYMSRSDVSTLGIIGSGREARSQLEAMLAVRSFRRVTCYSRTSERRERFATEMTARFGVEVTPVESGEACVADADVVCTITSANEPVLEGKWLKPGTHVNAVGATSLYRREIDDDVVRLAGTVVVEDVVQAREECGELIHAAERGLLRWQTVLGLHQLTSGAMSGRKHAEEITLYNALGVASEDVAVAAKAYAQACAQGIGVELAIPAWV
jgi:ornithine cyclodeaminase/alanine dehydrogenase-like protein (mu-crystallin family)